MAVSYQPLLSEAFLRAHFGADFEAFQANGSDTALLGRLRAWGSRGKLTEVQAEAGFLKTFLFETWDFWPDGNTGPEAGFTAWPRYQIPGAGAGGNSGFADLALGWFAHAPVSNTPQVVCEFKDIRSDLDAPQRRKGNTRSPVKQCADYLRGLDLPLFASAPIQPRFGIVSDMNEFRLYWRDRMPAQMLRFVIKKKTGEPGISLLEETAAGAFQRFLFARLFHRDLLLSKTGEPELLRLIRLQLVQERDLERLFYQEYRKYREVLIDTLIAANPAYPRTKGRLVRLAQKLLDRLIFILFCEDMGQQIAYPPQVLRDRLLRLSNQTLPEDGDDAWDMVRGLFRRMDQGGSFDGKTIQRFNGGLFAPDLELEELSLPNRVFFASGQASDGVTLATARPNLLYFAANYNFGTTSEGRAITLYTLGRIFEQSITELEALEAAKDQRPSLTVITKRKRDGVYYTPEYIVHMIVDETVGARLEDLRRDAGWDESIIFTHEEIDRRAPKVLRQIDAISRYQMKLKEVAILDPACGSGAFLISALEYLLAEHRRTEEERQRLSGGQAFIFDDDEATKGILSQNIYGVDINPASVELARLALWLHTARAGSVLSDLDATVRDGNSLVGPDIANVNSHYSLLPDAGKERINAFDWADAFPKIFAGGGFDCVIGNPPYVKLQNYKRVMPEVAEYLRLATAPDLGMSGRRYASAQTGNTDLYLPFIEKGLALLKEGGRMGYIAPSVWLLNEYGEGLRKLVHKGGNLDRWMDFQSFQIFEEAITYTALQFFTKTPNPAIRFLPAPEGAVTPDWSNPDQAVPYKTLPAGDAWTLLPRREREVMAALTQRCDRLDDVAAIIVGLQTSADDIYHLRKLAAGRYATASGVEVAIEDAIMLPLVSGKDVSPWATPQPEWHILFPYGPDAAGRMALLEAATMQASYPQAWRYLRKNEQALRARDSGKLDKDERWWGYVYPKNLDKQNKSKLFVAQTVRFMEVAPDSKGSFAADNVRVNCIIPNNPSDLWFLLATLHGKVCDWVFHRIAKPKSGGYFEANKQFIAPLPVPRADAAPRARLGRLAKISRALHTRRARAEAALQRRLEIAASRTEKPEWLLAGQAEPLPALTRKAPQSATKSEKNAWAKARQQSQIEAALDRAAILLSPGAELRCFFKDGELSLRASGLPVFDRIFVNPDEGEFLLLQWQLALRGKSFSGREGAQALFEALRKLRHSDNAALRDQAVIAGRRLFAYDAMIAKNESGLEAALFTAYALTENEKAVILGSAA
ncbi:MAG: Eco57I restriction-modification methylase domain-containing protein [Roseomonas sp.]|nr:Eco57I restriction-modification methylase domain-containing protein [Roseomonas sp.]MCA3427981.1 Eco57I restriction-modification methylase domain-containing protein [Roseomonas sp.]MCA3435361.1 Eco57I restriction-modification methylase domain-containing protein [Roseomonas sp.]